MNEQNILIGKTITAVYIAKDGGALRFDIEGIDTPLIVRADGDCCSHTWVETIDGPEQLIGSPVVSVEDVPMRGDEDRDGDVIAFYGCKITTGIGYATIDYRNESNGYYGGNLSWPGGEYDHFYGGVYGQNVSNEDWRKVA